MNASTDVDALGMSIVVPAGVVSASWAVERLGESGVFDMLGPIDTQLIALLRFASASDAALALPCADHTPRIQIPWQLASRVVAKTLLDRLPHVGDDVLVTGPFFDGRGLGRGPYRDPIVAAIGDGLLVYARTW
jgi:hypothetical protein